MYDVVHLLQLIHVTHLPTHLAPEAVRVTGAHRKDKLDQSVTRDDVLLDSTTSSCGPNRVRRQSRVFWRRVHGPYSPVAAITGVGLYPVVHLSASASREVVRIVG